MWWNDLNTLASTICTAVVLFGVFVLRPMVESFFDHRARQRLRQQKATALMDGRDPSRLDPDYLEHLQKMRLRDLQTVALEHGYDPLKLDPDYESEEKSGGDEEALFAQPHNAIYIQGYQGQQTGKE